MTKAQAERHELFAPYEDDLVFDCIDELVSDFASSDDGELADLSVIVAFLERAQEIGVTDFEAMTCDDVARLTLELLFEHEDDEDNVVDAIALFAEWLSTCGERTDTDEMIDAMFDLGSCELATVHPIAG